MLLLDGDLLAYSLALPPSVVISFGGLLTIEQGSTKLKFYFCKFSGDYRV